MATIRYLLSTYWENFMHLAWIYAKLSFIEDTHHRWPGAHQWHRVHITFHSSNQTYIFPNYSFSVEQTNNIVSLTIFRFILNISVKQTKFQYKGGSISNRNLTIPHSIDIYDSGQSKAIHPSFDLLLLTSTEFEKAYRQRFTSLRRYILAFSIETWILQRCLRRHSEVSTISTSLFTISTLSNNDVIHGYLGNSLPIRKYSCSLPSGHDSGV